MASVNRNHLNMLRKLVDAVSSCDRHCIQQLARDDTSIFHRTTPDGNTALHLAVRFKWWESAKTIRCCSPQPLSLLALTNAKGQTPLHLLATEGGQAFLEEIISKHRGEDALIIKEILRMVDANGDNALHLALRNNHEMVASILINLDGPQLSNSVNTAGESPLYLAARRRSPGIVKRLLECAPSNHGGPCNQTALHAAAVEGNTDDARELLDKFPDMDKARDEKGKIPLHQAVYWGNLKMVKILVEHDRSTAYCKDRDGNVAIHIAAQLDNVKIFRELCTKCPDSVDATNAKGENVLHMAIRSTTGEVVRFIGMKRELRRLINHQDENGNTPLHLAILEEKFHWNFYLFLKSKEADPWVRNNQGYTAVELFSSMRQQLFPNALELFHKLFRKSMAEGEDERKLNMISLAGSIKEEELVKRFEKHAGNVSLVATIMATITFAAAFTMPGAYDQNSGRAVLAHNTALRLFLISDTISMCCSLLVAYLFSSSKILQSPSMFHQNYALFTRYLMQTSFVGMMIAFAAGLYSVMPSDSRWLGIAILIICSLVPLITYIVDNFLDSIDSSINPVVETNVWVYGGLKE